MTISLPTIPTLKVILLVKPKNDTTKNGSGSAAVVRDLQDVEKQATIAPARGGQDEFHVPPIPQLGARGGGHEARQVEEESAPRRGMTSIGVMKVVSWEDKYLPLGCDGCCASPRQEVLEYNAVVVLYSSTAPTRILRIHHLYL